MSINVFVSGAPGYEDHFPARLMALVPKVDATAEDSSEAGSEMVAVLESANGDWHAIESKYVHTEA